VKSSVPVVRPLHISVKEEVKPVGSVEAIFEVMFTVALSAQLPDVTSHLKEFNPDDKLFTVAVAVFALGEKLPVPLTTDQVPVAPKTEGIALPANVAEVPQTSCSGPASTRNVLVNSSAPISGV